MAKKYIGLLVNVHAVPDICLRFYRAKNV